MSKDEVRLSQLVGLFGPGAMVDLPDRSVIIGGLERWEIREGGWKLIDEPRLSLKLQALLQQRTEIDPEQTLSLRTPPLPPRTHGIPPGVAATIFPTWFVSEQVEAFTSGGREGRGRQLVPWSRLDAAGSRKAYVSQTTGKKVNVTPIRFVGACPSGHLQDLNWSGIVHADGVRCRQPLWLEEQGTSGDPRDVTIACECGQFISLVQASAPGRLGKCRGSSPWLIGDDEGCQEAHDVSLLIRTATNTYFPQVATVISLPEAESALGRLVQANMNFLAQVTSAQQIAAFRVIEQFKAAFEGYGDDEILAALNQIREGAAADGQAPIKVAEFDRLAQGDPQIGRNEPTSRFYAETLPKPAWDDGRSTGRFIRNVVAVHRLREVSALYGFTRLEPAPTQDDGELEDIRLAVSGAPLAKETSWLPAIEQLGEGLFLHFDEREIQSWMSRPEVKEQASALQVAHDKWWGDRKASSEAPPAPGIAYVLLHTLSHALLTQIALDCGYPASSLKERVYAIAGNRGAAPDRCGILIYTASPGAQGSLGGLAGVAQRILSILDEALESQLICSSDPVCADHVPGEGGGDRSLLGAACHGCQLIAETSCEARNLYLDRNLIVATMAASSSLPLFDVGG